MCKPQSLKYFKSIAIISMQWRGGAVEGGIHRQFVELFICLMLLCALHPHFYRMAMFS